MSLFDWFRKKDQDEIKRRYDELKRHRVERRIVAGLSRNNLNLQNGRYITKKDLEEIRKKNRSHNYLKHKRNYKTILISSLKRAGRSIVFFPKIPKKGTR